ncbi:ATP-dependent Clp protease proteolytic subunit [Bacillus cereus]|nr:ATP-dependent Clp protease proteolytic subunit [Bacillus cereus]
MKNKIQHIPYQFSNAVNPENDEHEMVLSGYIGSSSWWYDAISAESVRSALKEVRASTVKIKLNSGGGDADQGVEIYNYLKDLDKKVIVEVTSLAASAASIIAMATDEIVMRTGSRMMIHEASTIAYGNKQDIQKTLNALEAYDESIFSIYQQKTGKSREEITDLLEAETWFTAEQAVQEGFADKVEFDNRESDSGITDEQLEQVINRVTKGSVPQGQKFGIWQNGGSNNVGYATNVYANGVTYVTFKAVAATSGNERKLSLYNFPSNTTKAVVEWVALYKGNKPQDWTPAPENQVTNAEFTKKATEIEKSVEGVKTTVTGVQNSQSGFEKRMTTVEQTASGLSNSVSQLGQTTTNQGKQITDAKSKLDQQAKLIEAKVNIKQVEDYVGGFQIPALKTTVDKNREEALKQIADKVATADYNKKTTEIDNRLKINEEGIGLSAKKTEVYTRVEANGTFATTAYVKTMEARIDVAERNINLSVKEGNVIAAINISKETIQLDAKRINLRGAVTAESIAGKLLEGVTIRAVDPNDRNKKAEMNASRNIFTEAIVKPTVENNDTSKYVTGLRAGELYSETYDESGKREYQMYTTAQGSYFSTGNDNSSYHAGGFAIRDNGQNKSVTAVAYSKDEGWRPVLACNTPTENEYGVFKSNGLKFVKYGSYQNQWVNEGNKSFISLYKARLSSDDGWWGYLQIKSGDDKSHSGVVATEYKTTSQRKMKTFIKVLQFDALQDVLGLKIKEYYFKSDINTLYKMREQRVEGQTPYTLNDIPKYYGFMVDDCPISFTDTDRKGVNLYASLSVTIKGFQQYVVKTDERLNEMEKVINNENISTSRNLRKSGGRTVKRGQSRKKHLFIAHIRTRSRK